MAKAWKSSPGHAFHEKKRSRNLPLGSSSMPEHPRQVIREHQFERDLRRLSLDAKKVDAFVEAAEFVLARDPEIGLAHRPGVRRVERADGAD